MEASGFLYGGCFLIVSAGLQKSKSKRRFERGVAPGKPSLTFAVDDLGLMCEPNTDYNRLII
jgi:hypothetical protein